MNLPKRIFKNSTYVLAGNVFSGIVIFILNALIARYLGAALFGDFSLVFAFISFFAVFASMGLDNILIRELAKKPKQEEQLINNALSLKLIFSGVSILLVFIILVFMPYSLPVKLGIMFFSASLLFNAMTFMYTTLFQYRLEMFYSFLAHIISKTVLLVLGLVIIFTQGGLVKLILAFVFSFFLQFLLIYLFSKKYVRTKPLFDKNICGFLFKESYPLALMGVFISIYYRIDVLMLSFMKDSVEIGLYSAAYVMIGALTLLSDAFMNSLYPLLSGFYTKTKAVFRSTYHYAFKYIIMLALPMGVGLMLLAEPLTLLLYGDTYRASALAVSLLVWSVVIVFFTNLFVSIINIIRRQKVTTFATFLGVLVNVGINLLLIPRYGFIGAAIGTVVTEGVILLILVFFLLQKQLLPQMQHIFSILLATAIMGLFVFYVDLYFLVMIPVAIVVYVALLFLLGVIGKEDYGFFLQIFKKS